MNIALKTGDRRNKWMNGEIEYENQYEREEKTEGNETTRIKEVGGRRNKGIIENQEEEWKRRL